MILDVGCGTFPKGDVNVDIDMESKFHRPFVLRKGMAKRFKNFIIADACHLPFRNDTFDSVYSTHVIEHMKNPVVFFKELIRVTKNMVFLKCPHRYWRPQQESHLSFLNVKWFHEALKNFPHKVELTWQPLQKIPFFSFPCEISVEIFKACF